MSWCPPNKYFLSLKYFFSYCVYDYAATGDMCEQTSQNTINFSTCELPLYYHASKFSEPCALISLPKNN